ncbi:hypothetical protein ACIA8K_37230 [Catenuloplanes sp. NPDC051500]|uniref:hypothetical protein n=1 Tax=Catenuloplanes sp. NPDC051500 TaxID=3363959 RepID=UPI00379BF0C8
MWTPSVLRALGVFATAALLSLTAASAWVPAPAAALIVIGLGVAAGVTLHLLDPWRPDVRGACLAVAVVATMGAGGLGASYARQLSLTYRGEPVIATVTAVSGDSYTLGYDGERIPGRLSSWPDGDEAFGESDHGRLGDTVIVLRDPLGLVPPGLPIDDRAGPTEAVLILTGLLAVITVLCVVADRDRRSGSS